MEYVHKAYGLRHNLYASTTQQTLLVFQALHLPEPCQQSMGGRSMVVSQVNELRFATPVHASAPLEGPDVHVCSRLPSPLSCCVGTA